MGCHVFLCRSLPLSTTVLNDICSPQILNYGLVVCVHVMQGTIDYVLIIFSCFTP